MCGLSFLSCSNFPTCTPLVSGHISHLVPLGTGQTDSTHGRTQKHACKCTHMRVDKPHARTRTRTAPSHARARMHACMHAHRQSKDQLIRCISSRRLPIVMGTSLPALHRSSIAGCDHEFSPGPMSPKSPVKALDFGIAVGGGGASESPAGSDSRCCCTVVVGAQRISPGGERPPLSHGSAERLG